MKWIEERDALIAQTKAFVEAVTRKSADSGRLAATPVRPAAFALSSVPARPAAPVARTIAPPAPAAPATKISASPAPAAPAPKASASPAPATPAQAPKTAPKTSETTRALPTLSPLERKFDQVSMSSEIRARIAAFRAHQERFTRERHEYFNATLARLRAEINELPEPVRRETDSSGNGRRPDPMPDQSRMPAAGVLPHRRPEGRT